MKRINLKNVVESLVCAVGLSLASHSTAAEIPKVTIGLIGDSTVADTYGWGPAFARSTQGSVRVLNFAKNGATLDSLSKRLDDLLSKQPEYVLIQFGHNDMKRYDTDAYGRKLTSYVERTLAAGSKPIVVSSVTRRNFDEQGKIRPREIDGRKLPDYALSAKAVAEKKKVPFIDLNTISIRHHNHIGPEASATYNFEEDDTTHFSREGAEAIAGLLIAELKKAVPELAEFFE